jgi:hypothetical protein
MKSVTDVAVRDRVLALVMVGLSWGCVAKPPSRSAATTTGAAQGQAPPPTAQGPEVPDHQANVARLMPESLHVVELSKSGLTYQDPNGARRTMRWDDLSRVEIVTTDQGPMVPDVFWVLNGGGQEFVIPQGATGSASGG